MGYPARIGAPEIPIEMDVVNLLDTAQGFIERSTGTSRLDVLIAAFQQALEQIGFRYFACGSHVDPLNPQQAVMALNYPHGWLEMYSERQLHRIDPVFIRADRTFRPFHWDDVQFLAGTTLEQHAMLEEAAQHGIAHGFTIPIHPQPGSTLGGSCSLIPDSPDLHPNSYLAAQAMAGHFFESAANAIGTRTIYREHVRLTARERQCIIWVGRGKTEEEIAMLLRLSASTVHSYISNAKRRFGVNSSHQVILRAIATGQISLSEMIES